MQVFKTCLMNETLTSKKSIWTKLVVSKFNTEKLLFPAPPQEFLFGSPKRKEIMV